MEEICKLMDQAWRKIINEESESLDMSIFGILTDIHFVRDQYNGLVGVLFTAYTPYGRFAFDTASCLIHDWKKVKHLIPDLCSELTDSIRSLMGQ